MRDTLLENLNIKNEYEYKVALPTTLFEELLRLKEDKTIKAVHIPVVYSYLFLTTYMYRYAKYSDVSMKTTDIKEVLGFAPNYKPIDYLIKKGGVLDSLGYTETTSDIPVDYDYSEGLKIITTADLDKENATYFKEIRGYTNRMTVKKPVFAYERDSSLLNTHLDGTFYDSAYTIIGDIRTFAFCMANEDLGVNAFYLYSYLQHMSNFTNGYDANHIRLASELGLSKGTIQKYRDNMRSHNMMVLVHNMEYFHPLMSSDKMKVSTNHINEYEAFSIEPKDYNKFKTVAQKEIDGTKNKTVEKDIVAEKIEFTKNIKVEIDLADLPY